MIIGDLRYCESNDDYYLVLSKEEDGFYETFWLKIGIASCHIEDIEKDILIKSNISNESIEYLKNNKNWRVYNNV